MADKNKVGGVMKVICKNRNANEYDIEERYVAGISLKGAEVKSIRQGKVSIDEAHVVFTAGRPFIINMYVAPYQNSVYNPEPTRTRALLLTKREIERIYGKSTRKEYKIIPLAVLLKENKLVKIEIGLGKKKKIWDKRREIIKKELERKEREFRRKL